MFKKNINSGNSRQLGGKDAKKFKADLAKHYPSLTEEETALLFPPKSIITLSKLSNRSIVYGRGDDNVPLFFDPSGRGDKVIPTVYSLALIPTLVSTLYTGTEVSSKILGGADLFLQGVILPNNGDSNNLEPFLAGSIRSVSVPGNPLPFAVGIMAVSSTQAVREGMKGRGLTVMHCYGDLLWGLGPKHFPPPNAGFSLNKIVPILLETQEAGQNSNASNNDESGIDLDKSNAPSAATRGEGEGESGAVAATANEYKAEVVGVVAEELGDLHLSNPSAATATAATSSIDIDSLLVAAALGGLKSVTNAELPLQFGDFYQKHMLPLRPQGVTFDFKASKKYKKLSKLLDVFEKEKVLVQKVIRKQDHISAVDRTHPLLVQWKGMPTIVSNSITQQGDTSPSSTSTTATSGNQKSCSSNSNTARQGGGVHVEYLYKPPTSLRPLFIDTPETCIADKERLFSEIQVATALLSYATANNLIVGGTEICIKLDNLLATSLWGKKEGPDEGSALLQDVLLKRLLTKLQQWHRILRPASPDNINNSATNHFIEVVRKGPIRPLSLVAEKRRGRNVTAIAHVETFGWSAEEIQSDYQRRFKTACSISKLPGKQENDYYILMQGDLLAKVEKYLKEVQGIDGKFILLNNKLSGKKK